MKVLAFLFSTLLLSLFGLGYCASLAVENQASVSENATLTPADLRRARQLINSVYASAGNDSTVSILTVNANDMDLLLSQMLSSQPGSAARTTLIPNAVSFTISLALPDNLFGSYLNIRMQFAMVAEQLSLQELKIGNLNIPQWLAGATMQALHTLLLQRTPEYAELISAIKQISISENDISIHYQLSEATLEQLASSGRRLFLDEQDSNRLLAHAAHLLELLDAYEGRNRVPLVSILAPMFRFAASRSDDAVEENRAVILVLALHQLDMDINSLLQGRINSSAGTGQIQFTLHRRRDIAGHYLGSAALTISTDSGIADSIGLLKELDDSRAGSGFSFTDLAADHAGIKFAELAVSSQSNAERLQALLYDGITDSFIMFDFSDLPEFLNEEQFTRSYSDISSPQYQELIDSIGLRISQTPLFSRFP